MVLGLPILLHSHFEPVWSDGRRLCIIYARGRPIECKASVSSLQVSIEHPCAQLMHSFESVNGARKIHHPLVRCSVPPLRYDQIV